MILRHFEDGTDLVSHRYQRSDTVIWGHFFGHSRFFDYEWAEKYYIKGKAYVIGIIAHIKGSTSTDEKSAYFSVYKVHKDQKPYNTLHSTSRTYKEINLDGTATRIMLDTGVMVEDSFFVSFGLRDYVHSPEVWGNDTMHLLATDSGARDEEDLKVFGRNCARTHGIIPELSWVDVYSGGWNSMNAYLALFPIMDFSYGLKNSYIDQGSFRVYKCFYNQHKTSIEVVISSKKQRTLNLILIDLKGNELTVKKVNLNGDNHKSFTTINVPPGTSPGNYILLIKGKGITTGQKVVIP